MKTLLSFSDQRRRVVSRGVFALTAFVAAACSDSALTTHPNPTETVATFGKGGAHGGLTKMVFLSNRGDSANYEVYSMNSDGSSQTRLTFSRAVDTQASLSPDRTKVVFVSTRDNQYGDIYVMKSDGTGVTRLTNSPGLSQRPSWSPDGTKIAFHSTRDAADPTATQFYSNYEIYTMNADGSNVKRITNNAVGDLAPEWSPDGLHIAFNSERDHVGSNGPRDLYLMNVDGSNVKRLTNQDGQIADASWDAQGKRLAYAVLPTASAPGIYVLDLKTLAAKRLTFNPGFTDAWPSFSPDGTQIAWAHYVGSYADIWVMNDDGSGAVQITATPGWNNTVPRWGR